jgi:uncharacterized protein YkwD
MLAAALAASALSPSAFASTSRHSAVHRARARAHAAVGCFNADTRANRASTQAMRTAVLCLVNHQRIGRHLPALRELRRLDRSAQRWTDSMVWSGNFSHTGGGSDPGARISAAGFSWSAMGENIATGFPTPRDVVSVWMGSTGHCHNILDPQFSDVGTGVSTRPVSGFASGPATWTQDFGLPMGTRAPSGNWGPANRCPY